MKRSLNTSQRSLPESYAIGSLCNNKREEHCCEHQGPSARRLQASFLGTEDPATTNMLMILDNHYEYQEHVHEAIVLAEQALALRRRSTLSEDHGHIGESSNGQRQHVCKSMLSPYGLNYAGTISPVPYSFKDTLAVMERKALASSSTRHGHLSLHLWRITCAGWCIDGHDAVCENS
jgi:hypothetical protein